MLYNAPLILDFLELTRIRKHGPMWA